MKLVYFNARGLAETARFMLAIAGIVYTDVRYTREEFDADKGLGLLVGSLNKLPFLEIDGEVIPQSKTIERYIATRYNMFGRNDFDMSRIDAICEYVRDLKTEYQKTRGLSEGNERDAGMDVWFNDTLPARLKALDAIVGSDFSVGFRVSLADVTLYTFVTQFFTDTERAYAATDTAPNIKSVVRMVGNIPEVGAWIIIRPKTSF
jgi:glutathione S-transferase